MRGGICTIQQILTTEAAGVVNQALHLARRRNHSQVTPLHVAVSLLESSSSLLRKACLRSNSHPLQCKALELCFNVSLNRLPTSTLSIRPFLVSSHSSSSSLSLSNALVAAFKRAQAHQRRGSIESQQQPILALKIEMEQLVISILDDPSVSRVMREAGFSSTQVKINVQQATSLEFFPQSSPPFSSSTTSLSKNLIISPLIDHLRPKPINQAREKDVTFVINALMKDQKRNNVIVGECFASAENVVKGVMDKIKRGVVDEKLKCMQFINLPLLSFKNASKEEIEQKLLDLKYIIRTDIRKGLVLYLGDLKWVSELWSNCCEQNRSYYFPIQHMIMEIRRLVCTDFRDNKLCLMGIANFQSYMKCKAGHPSLESIWNLRALSIPVESLGLSLKVDSDWQAQSKSMASLDLLSARRSRDSVSPKNTTISLISNLPPWLQCYKEEKRLQTTNNERFEYDSIMSVLEKDELKPDLLSNPNSSPNSVTSSEAGEGGTEEDLPMFKEFNTENVSTLCTSLEKKVPWQKEIILEIVNTVIQCRSGMIKKRGNEETWLIFLGADAEGKLKIAQELARLIFRSLDNFISINSSTSFTSTRADSTDELRNKRKRDEMGGNYMNCFAEAVHENPHRVFFLEEFEQLDYNSQMGIKRAIENGTLTLENGELVHFEDAIVIFSCESLSSISRACSPPQVQPLKCKQLKEMNDEKDEEDEFGKGQVVEFDLNTAVGDDEHTVLDVGINEVVDRQIMFKFRDLESK